MKPFQQSWARYLKHFDHADPVTLEYMQLAFYFGALAYSDLLRNAQQPRQEVEDFLAASPLVTQR